MPASFYAARAAVPSNYYRVLEKGIYQCLVCRRTYAGSVGRHTANKCCFDKKPVSELALKQADDVLNEYLDKTRLTDSPDDAGLNSTELTLPPRAARAPRRTTAQVIAAGDHSDAKTPAAILGQRLDAEKLKADKAFFERLLDDVGYIPKRKRSALQNLAYAYHLRNWPAVRLAAQAWATDMAIGMLRSYNPTAAELESQLVNGSDDEPEREYARYLAQSEDAID